MDANQNIFLLCPVGSAGDVYPYLGLGKRLVERGHRVVVLTSGYFREATERLGLEFVDVLSRERFLELTENPLLWDPWRGASAIFEAIQPDDLTRSYQAIVAHYVPGRTVALTSALGFSLRCAHETLGIPLVSVDLQPLLMWSKYDSPIIPGLVTWAPPWFKQMQFQIGSMILDRLLAPRINPFRAELGLKPVKRDFFKWIHSPQSIIGLYPEWYASPQPDWPPQMRLTQFPMWNERGDEPLPENVERFVSAGSPPIVFTPGSANCHGREFFIEAAEACRRMGKRGMLFTRFPESLPRELPEGVEHFEYAPFSNLLPRVAAISHHGGIGTTSAALAAGIPQLIMPLAHDQPDNLARLKRMQVGDGLSPKKYRAAAVVEKLSRLIASAEVQASCAEAAQRFLGVDPYDETLEIVESLLGKDVKV